MMPYKVLLAKTAFKSYLKITGKLRTGVDRCFLDLANSPEHGSSIRKLTGFKDCFRYQIGGIRVLYEVHKDVNEVRIYAIRPRGDVYKH